VGSFEVDVDGVWKAYRAAIGGSVWGAYKGSTGFVGSFEVDVDGVWGGYKSVMVDIEDV
jgi:hypothetical protein